MNTNAPAKSRTGARLWFAIALIVLAVVALAFVWNAPTPPHALASLAVLSTLSAAIIWLAIWPRRRNGQS